MRDEQYFETLLTKQLNNINEGIYKLQKRKRFVLFRQQNLEMDITAIKIMFEIFDYIKQNPKKHFEGNIPIYEIMDYSDIKWGEWIKKQSLYRLSILGKIECIDKNGIFQKSFNELYNDSIQSVSFVSDFNENQNNKLPLKLLYDETKEWE